MLSGRSVLVAAPTGLAAQNVDGVTLHKAFKLPIQKPGRCAYRELSHDEDKEMARDMYRTKLIIIDEVSMVSNVVMMMVHLRLMGMLGKKDGSRFAGLNVVVLGDLLQLPPVDDKMAGFCFEPIAKGHWRQAFPHFPVNPFQQGLWREFGYSELEENMRQKDDGGFKEMLNEVRVGMVEKADEMLKERVWKSPSGKSGIEAEVELLEKLKTEGKNPVCLVPLRSRATELNTAMLVEEKVKVKFLHAFDTRTVRESRGRRQGGKAKDADMGKGIKGLLKYMKKFDADDKRKTGNLAQVLALGVGARVMLTRNINVDMGLYNGAMGTVKGFLESRKAKGQIVAVIVRFDDCGEDVEVGRSTASFEKSTALMVTREQFSLELAYAMTVHKSQGLSLDCVVADVGAETFEKGQAYVALSRARSLAGLHLLAWEPSKVQFHPKCVAEYNRLRSAYTTLGPLQTGPPPKSDGRPKQVRKTVDELMDVSPTLHSKTCGRKRKLQKDVTLTEDAMVEALTEEPAPQLSSSQMLRELGRELDAGLRAREKELADAGLEEDEDGITIEVLKPPLEPPESAEPEAAEPVDLAEDDQLAFVPLLNQHPTRSDVENICFANSVTQMLLRSAVVRDWLMKAEEAEMSHWGHLVRRELMELFTAACEEDRRVRNVRKLRDAVARFSEIQGGVDFANYEQHCAMDFAIQLVEACGAGLERLVRFQRPELAKCTRCQAPERELSRTTDTVWKLYLDDGSGRGGEVTLQSLVEKDLADEGKLRCPACCDQADKVMVRGKLVPNEGVIHRVRREVVVLGEQKLLLLMVNPFYFDRKAGQMRRSRRRLVGLDPEGVELAGRKWRVVSGLEFQGAGPDKGHYVSYSRQGSQWRWMSDMEQRQLGRLPVEKLYGLLLELVQ